MNSEPTKEMVDAALSAWFSEIDNSESDAALEASMRRAITAALAAAPAAALSKKEGE